MFSFMIFQCCYKYLFRNILVTSVIFNKLWHNLHSVNASIKRFSVLFLKLVSLINLLFVIFNFLCILCILYYFYILRLACDNPLVGQIIFLDVKSFIYQYRFTLGDSITVDNWGLVI